MADGGDRQSSDAFARSLFAQLPDGVNVAVSPSSIEACVLLAFAGARGETADAIAKALELGEADRQDLARLLARSQVRGGSGKNAPILTVANSAWVERGFPIVPSYRKLLEASAGATFETVDFSTASDAARTAINRWIDTKTNHKIRELLGPGAVDASTRLVLANAVYYKGRWLEPFPKRATKDAPFHRPGQKDVNVPLMFLHHDFRYLETDTYQAVEIPYQNSPYAMIVWLPRKIDGLAKLESEWAGEGATKSLEKLATAEVELYLPKFKVEATLSLAETLGALGMGQAFTPAADFSGISSEKLWISAVVHQALVEVDEEGTEAAAATAIVAPTAALAPEERVKKVFRADHPFLFAIRHGETGEMLFLGRVETPRK
jgi:serpin B